MAEDIALWRPALTLCYLLHCSYNPYDGPNEHPEAELPLVSGKYLYVYGTMDEDGFYEGRLLSRKFSIE
jgi:hypothetical protein